MWLRPGRPANVRSDTSVLFPSIDEAHTRHQGSWGSSTLLNEESSSPVSEDGDDGKFTGPSQCAWSPSSSTTTDSDPSGSRISIATSSKTDDLPEIPFISASLPLDRKGSGSTYDDDDSRSTYWPHAATPSPSWDRPVAILGEAAERHPTHGRGRSSSLSSTASRPAPAKSILSSSASVRTRKGRSPPSVKFLDMPMVHLEEEEGEFGESEDAPAWPRVVMPRSPVPLSPPPSETKKSPFAWLKRLTIPVARKRPDARPAVPERPLISGPMRLCEAPRCNTLPRRNTVSTSGRSIRSTKSTASLRSVRSCASRLQVYWGRLGTN
ncbi:hypothetical protein EIP86_009849 [Pleurotus ostreatoroseus]|nr:hypothetical protein EIP86_009849 [Pleurotus ostreatoroseus]